MYLTRYSKPKLTGVVVKETVRCGKSNCRCNSGKLHKWYYYLYYREFEDGSWKLKKEYVPKNKVKYMRRKIQIAKRKEMAGKINSVYNTNLLQKTTQYLKGKLSLPEYYKFAYEITQSN